MTHLLELSRDPLTKRINGEAFYRNFENYNQNGMLETTYGATFKDIKGLAEIAKTMDPKQAKGAGVSWVEQGLAVAVPSSFAASVATGGATPAISATAAITAWLVPVSNLSTWLNDPVKARQLLQVAKMTEHGQAYARAVGQLLSTVTGEKYMRNEPVGRPLQSLQAFPNQP